MRRLVAHLVLGLLLVPLSDPMSAQAQPRSTAALSANTIRLGETFELRVSLTVPRGSAVYFPDRLPVTESVEGHGQVRWEAETAPEGATLKLTYPLIAFGMGNVPVPGFQVRVRPASEAAGGNSLPGGSFIGAWDRAPSSDASSLLATIAPQEIRVASVLGLEGVLAGVGPMPAADVVGPNRHLPSLVSMLVFSSVLIGVFVATTRKWLLFRTAADDEPPQTTTSSLDRGKRAALTELDDLLALGLHADGRMREFYTSTSQIVRRYIEQLDPCWGSGLTSTELMQDLRTRANGDPVERLSVQMSDAEIVKFGRLRPEVTQAEAHWRSVRRWVAESGGGTREL